MAIVITDEQRKTAFSKAGADLSFLLDRKQVDEDFQGKLYHLGVISVELFAVFAKDQDDLEGLLKTHFDLDPKDILQRVKAGRVIVAWTAAKARFAKQAEVEGECEARKVLKDIGMTDVSAMRAAFEKNWWELEEDKVPAKTYLE